jgi:hypothetical protein
VSGVGAGVGGGKVVVVGLKGGAGVWPCFPLAPVAVLRVLGKKKKFNLGGVTVTLFGKKEK